MYRLLAVVLAFFVAVSFPVAAQTIQVAYLDSDEDRQILEELKTAFKEENPSIEVELVRLSSREAASQLPQWLATGSKADLYLLSVEILSWLEGANLFIHMDDLRGFDFRSAFEAFPPGIRKAFSDGRGQVGVPLTAEVDLFQYNADLFQNAGLPPLSQVGAEWTWHDMIDMGRRISDPGSRRYFLDLDLEFAAVYFLAHGPVLSPDGRSSTILNESNVEILKLAQQAIHRDRISLRPSAQRDRGRRFRQGLLAVRRAGLDEMLPAAAARSGWLGSAFAWDVAPFPLSPFTKIRPALGASKGLVAAVGGGLSPDVARFLYFGASREGQMVVARSGLAFPGSAEAWRAVLETGSGPPHNRSAFLEAVQNWTFFTFPRVALENLERLAAPLAAVLEGQLSPSDGLAQTARLFDQMLGEEE